MNFNNNAIKTKENAVNQIDNLTITIKKSANVAILRFVIILLIVGNHTGFPQLAADDVKTTGIKIWFDFTSPILALLSGWLFFINLTSHNYLIKVKSRFFSLVVPYVLWVAIYICLHAVIKSVYFDITKSTFWESKIPTFSLDYFAEVFWTKPIVSSFWYLKNLILIIPFNWIALQLLKKPFTFELLYLTVLCLLFFNIDIVFSDRFIQFYMTGCYLGSKRFDLNRVKFKNKLVNYVSLSLLLVVEWWLSKSKFSFVTSIPVVVMITVLALGLLRCGIGVWIVSLLDKWSKHAFFIFAAHSIVISVVGKIAVISLPEFLFRYPGVFFVLLSVQMIATILICLIISSFTLRIKPGLWHFLTGGRD